MDETFTCAECGQVLPSANTPHTYNDCLRNAKYIVWFSDGFGMWEAVPAESKDRVRAIIEANKPEDNEYIVTCPKLVLTEDEQKKHDEAVKELFRKGREIGRTITEPDA
jgi:hypothetical protein